MRILLSIESGAVEIEPTTHALEAQKLRLVTQLEVRLSSQNFKLSQLDTHKKRFKTLKIRFTLEKATSN